VSEKTALEIGKSYTSLPASAIHAGQIAANRLLQHCTQETVLAIQEFKNTARAE